MKRGILVKKVLKEILETSIYIVVVLVITLLIVTFVGQRTHVNGSSMWPTLEDGDNLIVDKISYRFSSPKRYDIIVFPFQYAKDTYYIKRIIGLPGEAVQIDDSGIIYINDEPLSEEYGTEIMIDPGVASERKILKDNEYFVLGDNRNESSDSRDPSVGLIEREIIIGKAWIRIFPFDKFGSIKHQ